MPKLIAFFTALTLSGLAYAGDVVTVKNAWVRAPVPGAEVAAAYMTLESTEPATLTGASSPAAKAVEIHTMGMKNGVMEMRQIPSLDIKPGQAAKLQPGGLHLMMIDLTQPMKAGDQVEVDLHFSSGKNLKTTQRLRIPVKTAP